MMKSLMAILVSHWVVAGALAAEGNFVYSQMGVPKNSTGCLESAILLGQKLEQATGRKVKRALCEREHTYGFDLRVEYGGETALPLVSTEERNRYAGTYFKFADCEADLANQVAQFETRTKLRPFNAYCYVDESGLQRSIGSKIDAFGNPVERPYVFDGYLFSRVVNPAAVEAELTSALKAMGYEISVVKMMPPPDSMGYGRLVAKYYGTETNRLELKKEEFYLDSAQNCEQQMAGVRALLNAQGINPVVTFCTGAGLGRRAAINFVTKVEAPWYSTLASSDRFKTYGECTAQISRIVDYFKNVLKQPVFGGVCGEARGFMARREFMVELLQPCAKAGAQECRRPTFP